MKARPVARRAKESARQARKKAHRVRAWWIAAMAGCLTLVGAGAWWAAQHSLPEISALQVSEIEIRGNDHVPTKEVLSRLDVQGSVNIFQLDIEALVDRLTKHPWIRTASIQRHPPLRLVVTIEEREPVAVLSTGKTYLVSKDAVILDDVRATTTGSLPAVRAQWRVKYQAGERLTDPRILRGLELIERFRNTPPLQGAQIAEVTAEADGNYILHLAEDKGILRLGMAESLPQLDLLDIALRRHGRGLESLAYVDLRFPGRVILHPSEKGG